MNDADQVSGRPDPATQEAAIERVKMADLKPKGACWYCNHPLDNVRRFCSKACADDYRIEEEAFNNPAG